MGTSDLECICSAHEADETFVQPSFQFDDVVFSQECADFLAGITGMTGVESHTMNTAGTVYESKERQTSVTWSECVTL